MPRIRLTLEAALQHADMSGRELARRAQCHNDTVSKYRHGMMREVSLDLLERFCAALDCQLADVLTDQPPASVPQSSKWPAPTLQPPTKAPAAPERQPKATSWMRRPTIAEFHTLIARKQAGAFRPGDAQRLAAIMTYWPCWDMTDEEWDVWHPIWEQARGARV